MRPCFQVEIVTPKKVLLNGLWFGPRKARTALIFVHGLTASAFSLARLRDELTDGKTAILVFNNRGFEQIAEVKKRKGQKTEWIPAGAGREVFKESVDDIQGAVNFAKRQGAREIFLVGHSTGAQKIVYWAARSNRTSPVRGLVLLGPLSDYAGTAKKYRAALKYAHALIKKGKKREFMPTKFGHWFPIDAQRFVSLYDPASAEEIFTYASGKRPATFREVRLPVLAVFAGTDEHADRPVERIATWFKQNGARRVAIMPNVGHSLRGAEKRTAKTIRQFMKEAGQ
ncbi:MAG: alpha/beta fold hydrolase [Candidatus Kaiserbacteria bacterium]|nr:alpha/beta fold hydrolase [Candidatus Kaiserbacteria bacterium]